MGCKIIVALLIFRSAAVGSEVCTGGQRSKISSTEPFDKKTEYHHGKQSKIMIIVIMMLITIISLTMYKRQCGSICRRRSLRPGADEQLEHYPEPCSYEFLTTRLPHPYTTIGRNLLLVKVKAPSTRKP